MKIVLVFVASFFLFISASAQSLQWWSDLVHWDGYTPWERYLNFTAGYLGPNALPVPPISTGSIDNSTNLGVSGAFHYSKNDQTWNGVLYANYCLVKDKISFDAFWVPFEYYTLTPEIKAERHVFALDYYDRHSIGDIHLSTNIQLFKKNLWQSALRIGYRFPTSDGLGTARFTDAPGYWFDISFGKNFTGSAVKWITMLGGYFWQADNVIRRQRQDDALLVGTGMEINKNDLKLQTYFAGYFGYFQLKDDPVVFRFNIDKTIKRHIFFLHFQQGLHDLNYTTTELGYKYILKKK